MPDTDVFRLQRSDLNPFLFATVGTEPNGMSLSVVSMLARRGSDPWAEASRLAGQARQAATRELAGFIAGTSPGKSGSEDTMAIATRLAALLPTAASRASSQAAKPYTPQPGLWDTALLTRCAIALVVGILIARVLDIL